MKRGIWMFMAAVIVVTAAVTLIALPRGAEWTTCSPEALREFEAAMEAQTKLYHAEAKAHMDRAIELDPNFLIAKLEYREYAYGDKERADQYLEDVLTADLSGLTPRERFMIERFRLLKEKRRDEATELLDAYLEAHPNDPWVVYIKAMEAWSSQDNDNAEMLYLRLLEISPNWVIAYNQLGYITMLQGRFAEAEEYFTSYRFIAPDQANPHDSLGELFVILGRYAEAEDTFNRALEIKPDFWASYEHLIMVRELIGDSQGAQEIIESLADRTDFDAGYADMMSCAIRYSQMARDRDWQQILSVKDSECFNSEKPGEAALIFTHRAACKDGDWKLAEEIEAMLGSWAKGGSDKRASLMPFAIQAEGVRLALQGNLDEAIARFQAADEGLTYINAGLGIFKLQNRLMLAEALHTAGREDEARKLLEQVRAINPEMVAEFKGDGLRVLGLTS